MIRNNNLGRNITGINKIDTTTIAISLTNKIIGTDSGGQFYGITNSTGNFLKDVDGAGTYAFTQITSDDVEFNLNGNIVPVTDSTGKILTLVVIVIVVPMSLIDGQNNLTILIIEIDFTIMNME